MPRLLEYAIDLRVLIGDPVLLLELESHRQVLDRQGVYFLCRGIRGLEDFSPQDRRIFYIGKAANETIFSRCRKHRTALEHDVSAALPPGIRPGRRFRSFRSSADFELHDIQVVPGFTDERAPYAPTCAEEYLLHCFQQQ